jgi:hypothetical protein
MFDMLFHYYPAFVAQVVDASKVRIWLQHPKNDHINYDLNKTIVIDLEKTPSNPRIQWDDIEVDDYINHEDVDRRGFTSLGPVMPHFYGAIGVYISASYYRRHREEMENALDRPEELAAVSPDAPEPPKTTKAQDPGHGASRRRDDHDKHDDHGKHDNHDNAKLTRVDDHEETAFLRLDGGKQVRYHGYRKLAETTDPDKGALYLIAHPGVSTKSRAPCAAVIKATDMVNPQETWTGDPFRPAPDEKPGPIYLSKERATAVGLDIPKRPSVSGEGVHVLRERGSAPAKPIEGGPLNILEDDSYNEVARIRDKLIGNRITIGRGNQWKLLLTELTCRVGCRFTSLDLIGHARRDGALRFNGLVLTATTIPLMFKPEVVEAIRALYVSQVRVLGCRTACSPVGGAALSTLYRTLNPTPSTQPEIQVRGTRADLLAVHYARGNGFTENRLLVVSDGKPGVVGDPPPSEDEIEVTSDGQYQATPPASLAAFPLARDSSSNPETKYVWRKPKFDKLADCVDFRAAVEADPLDVPCARAFFIDEPVVRAFDLIKNETSNAQPPDIDMIRLDFADGSASYRVRSSPALYTLLGDPIKVVEDAPAPLAK